MSGKSSKRQCSTLISLRIPTDHLNVIDTRATKTDDRSAIIKRAIRHYIQEVLCGN